MYDNFGLFIDGRRTAAFDGRTAPVFSLVSERPLGHVPLAGLADTEAAIASASTGFAAWKVKSAFERVDVEHAIADEMELGGNASLINSGDADLEAALNAAGPTKFANAGQVCVTADRFCVHDACVTGFVAGFVAQAKTIKLGDGLDPLVNMGPLINAGRLAEMEKNVSGATQAGDKLALGGARAAGFDASHFFEPTVLTDCADEMTAMAEENFGPIAAITRSASDDEVLAPANASDMGLSACAFTQSPKRARRTVAELKAGINSFATAAAEAPFGATNHSGMGLEGGIEAIRDDLDVRSSQMVWA